MATTQPTRRKDRQQPGNGGRFTQPVHGRGELVDIPASNGMPVPAADLPLPYDVTRECNVFDVRSLGPAYFQEWKQHHPRVMNTIKPADREFWKDLYLCPGYRESPVKAVSNVRVSPYDLDDHTGLGYRLYVLPGRPPGPFRSDRFPSKCLRLAVTAKRDGDVIHILDDMGQTRTVLCENANWLDDGEWVDDRGYPFNPWIDYKICDDAPTGSP